MSDNEELDVKDFPLFESNDVDYYTYTIVSGKDNDRNEKNNSTETAFGNKQSTHQTETEEGLHKYKEIYTTVKTEPDEHLFEVYSSNNGCNNGISGSSCDVGKAKHSLR